MDGINMSMQKAHTGFTLIELMMVLLIGAILASLAVPSFINIIRDNRLASQTNDFISALNFARSEAIKRGTNITVCSSDNQASCNSAAPWQDGWVIVITNTGELLRAHAALDGSTLVNQEGNTNIQYTARGMLNGNTATTFNLCIDSGVPGRQISITATGRPRSTKYTAC